MNKEFDIESGGFELLSEVELMWYELKDHHSSIDQEFYDLSTPTFELRMKGLKEKGTDILVDIVREKVSDLQIGYCFSIIDKMNMGEIESLFIREEFRRSGLGTALVERAISWMDEHRVVAKKLSVRSGNREAIDFYRSFGFQSRVQELMIPNNPIPVNKNSMSLGCP